MKLEVINYLIISVVLCCFVAYMMQINDRDKRGINMVDHHTSE